MGGKDKLKILYVHAVGKTESSKYIIRALEHLGHTVIQYPGDPASMSTGFLDENKVNGILAYMEEQGIDALLSLFFVMNVALAAYKGKKPYISILWDAPYQNVYNPLAKLDNMWISTFDRLDRDRFATYGIRNAMYQPLSVSKADVMEWNREIQETLQGHYFHDICFVGRLYENNSYDRMLGMIPTNMQYYFNSIFEEAAFRWDGVNRVYGKTGQEILDYIKMTNPEFSIPDTKQDIEEVRYFEALYLIRKLAHIERMAVLGLLAEAHEVTLYTFSQQEAKKLQNVHVNMPVMFGKAASLVYAGSKINLNISLKGIEGGTPQRIMDIMSAGGFVLSSYGVETAELFEEDKEIVMFRTPEELVEKVDYYLAHDREREQIARAGYEKVINCFTYEKKMKELMDWVARA